MNRLAAFLIALLVLVAVGFVHGMWGNRWGRPEELDTALARVALVPAAFGDWQAKDVELTPGDQRSFELAGAQRYWMRAYLHRRSQAAITVVLMCGRAGRMAVHTPEVCYRGAGYEMDGVALPVTVSGEAGVPLGAFWTARFSKHTGVASDLRLYWAWTADGVWQAPSSPRWLYRGAPFLYKLYVSQDAIRSDVSTEATPEFLRQFLPQVKQALFPGT